MLGAKCHIAGSHVSIFVHDVAEAAWGETG